jgi:hypothetical protein
MMPPTSFTSSDVGGPIDIQSAILRFICNTSSKEEVGADRKKSFLLDEEFWSEMRRHYPNVDVDAESRKMDAWLLARPGRKKTRQFVINWLNKVEPALAPAKVEEVEQW